eukprot:CAMPEP_0194498306 /NCGR_PEP_ID=MMETSP0253-20130528/14977_1 /TAXON_ID=2966 /ORGANISM="Noctiluca scintillans" /LENGTH=51 /DNA_ID=CAMNT_0039339927 /DNA_START=24 /DNA_END=179 /DNA_ORIENTATION=-
MTMIFRPVSSLYAELRIGGQGAQLEKTMTMITRLVSSLYMKLKPNSKSSRG